VNLILLDASDFAPEADPDPGAARRVVLRGRRLAHVREICRTAVGDRLRVGRTGGDVGEARVLRLTEDELELEVVLDRPPPAPVPIDLVLALPRPPSLRKVLQQATAMGVKRIALIASRRVEKSYWQSHALEPAAVEDQLRLGLEQARDTVLPEVSLHRRFRPFAEDDLPRLLESSTGLLADPEASETCPRGQVPTRRVTLVVGPEGGFIPFERDLLLAQGMRAVGLGPRVLRVETAVVALLARLAP